MNRAHLLGLLVTVGACAVTPPRTAPAPRTGAVGAIGLPADWRSNVIVERNDSILLTLPSGALQVQRFNRVAGFTVTTGNDGTVAVRLDSLRTSPSSPADRQAFAGATWTGRVTDVAVDALRLPRGNPALELTPLVRWLLPRLPAGGAQPGSTWFDSATGTTAVDIFQVTERRTATWSAAAGKRGPDDRALPIRIWEDFEQFGSGTQNGLVTTMTAQGRRTGLYYVFSNGVVRGASLTDSSVVSIGAPESRGLVSGRRVIRTEIRFIPVRGDR